MRLINRTIYPVHIWKVSDYIKQTQANIIKEDVSQFITMQNIFKKLYFRHLEQYEKLQKQTNRLNNFVRIAPTPARSIADYFYKRSKYYWQDYMRATFEAIAQSYQISKRDNGGSLDNLGYTLFLSSQFTNLSEEFKYALRNNKINFNNLIAILQSLIKLEYIDNEIINLVLLYLKRQFQGEDPCTVLSGWSGDRYYQIQKKDYYNPVEITTLQSLRKSEQVQTAISLVKHFYEQAQSQRQERQSLKSFDIQDLNRLIDEVADTTKNFRKIVQGLINIRKQYVKIVQFSSTDQVLRNPNLNLGLLQVEEKLLALKILDMQDLHNINQMKNPEYQVKRIQNILLMYLDVKKLDPIFALVDKSPVEAPNYVQSTQVNPHRMSVLLNFLSRLASIDRFVYHAADGRSLVNLKWEKTLTEQYAPKTIPGTNYNQELNVSRIFRRVYHDVLKMMMTYDNKIKSVYKRSNVSQKLLVLDALCRMGLHQSAINEAAQFQNEDFDFDVNTLSQQNFAVLISLFNDIGLFINNEDLKQKIYRKLEDNIALEQQNQLNYDLAYSINTVNYLLQNHRSYSKFDQIYGRYLQKLEEKATYYTPSETQNELVVEAFKILAIQIPEKYGSHPVYLNYVHEFVNDNYKKNPYLSILRETCYKLSDKEHWLNKMQLYLNVGVKNGLQNGIVFSNSDQTSIDGEFRSGNLNSFIIRLQLKNNMKIHQFSVNSFLNINYQSTKIFEIKPFAELEQRFSELFEPQRNQIIKQFGEIESSLLKILPAFKQCIITNQIKFKLATLSKFLSNNSNFISKEQQVTNSVAFLLQILELNKLFILLKQQDILKSTLKPAPVNPSINTPLQLQTKNQNELTQIPIDVNNIKSIMKSVRAAIPDLLNATTKRLKYPEISESAKLKGQRLSIQTWLDRNEPKRIAFEEEFLNYRYFSDNTFCEYNDWRQKIQQQYHLAEFDQEKLSDLTKILTNRLCKGVSNKLTLLPICKHSQRLKKINLEFKMLKGQKQTEATRKFSKQESKELDYIINLQNFKHQLKMTRGPKQLLDYIFGFNFIFELGRKGSATENQLLKRDPVEYFNYLQELNERTYLQSPYIKYILSKLSKTDNIKRLIEHRKNIRITQRNLYQKGLINSKTYYQKISQIDNMIIDAVEQLKTKMLDHMEDTLLDGELKMLDIKKDELEAFQQIIFKNITYSRQFDQDFIYANGDYQKALNLKRGRAQSNYIKLYLIKKITDNKGLNIRQMQLLKSWEEEMTQSLNQYIVHQDYTSMLISQLPWEDMQALKLKQTSLNASKDMPLIDLIMELNLFLDESLIMAYEKQFKAELISKKFGVPQYLFEQSAPVGFKKLENQIEEAIINQKSKMNRDELKKLQSIFKIFKTEGFKERNRYDILCARFRQNVEKMNQSHLRSNFIQEYVRHLEEEFTTEYNPELIKNIKEKETDKLWKEVFFTHYNECTSEILKKISKKIILRLELLQNKTPPFFGSMLIKLLLHPKLDILTKQSLIAAIEAYKFDLNLDSADIEAFSRLQGRQLRESKEIMKDLKSVSKSKVGKQLLDKMKLLN